MAQEKIDSPIVAARDLPPIEQIQHSTMLIRCLSAKGELSSGTGFLFSFFKHQGQEVIAIVTNKHVLAGADQILLRWTLGTKDNQPDYGKYFDFRIEKFAGAWTPHPDPSVDLAIIPCGPLYEELTKRVWPLTQTSYRLTMC